MTPSSSPLPGLVVIVRRALLAVLAVAALLVPGAAWVAGASAHAPPTTAAATTRTRLMPGVALYPRLIRLRHSGIADGEILAGVVTFDGPDGEGAILRSTDEGASFHRIGTVADPHAAHGLCCATLYELPQAVGALPAGTLLWAASVGQAPADRRMQIRAWASTDHGRSWSLLATIARAQDTHGLWEPEFTLTRDGRLVCLFSDETQQPAHSQTIVASVSSDGVHWSPRHDVVALTDPAARPGMPVVRVLGSGAGRIWIMSYEICGSAFGCRVHERYSPDGRHWGALTAPGTPVSAEGGLRFAHAPTITALGRSRLLLVGQVLQDRAGASAPGNGGTLMVNDHSGLGAWRTAPAPVRVPDAHDDYCPNYSSMILPIHDGQSLMEIATDYDGSGVCTAYVGTEPIPR